MKSNYQFIAVFLLPILLVACQTNSSEPMNMNTQKQLSFEQISFYNAPYDSVSTPIQYRVEYYFENGLSYRWIDLDSSMKIQTDYIYEYDQDWNHIGAKYIEPGEEAYAVEKVRFENDSTQITEWLDENGEVYYTMIDELNKNRKTIRATFKGDEVHGYDSTFYTPQGFVKRIFFTNIKGKVFNDRSFAYDSINENNDWVLRRKVVNDNVESYQKRQLKYDSNYSNSQNLFYPGAISTGEYSENVFSFTKDESTFFHTKTSDWYHQKPYLSQKKLGLIMESLAIQEIDTLYNGAISPNGKRIIFSKRHEDHETIYLISKGDSGWSDPINLTNSSGIQGGYFFWIDESNLIWHIPNHNGDIVKGSLKDNVLKITDSLSVINRVDAAEFSAFTNSDMSYLIFTRYLEGDPSQQGFFISYNKGTNTTSKWSEPTKLDQLPYGWNPWILKSSNQFLFTDGDDIFAYDLDELSIQGLD